MAILLLCSRPLSSPPKRLFRERLQAIAIAVARWLTLKTIVKGKPMKPDTSESKYTIVVGIDRSDKELEAVASAAHSLPQVAFSRDQSEDDQAGQPMP